MDVVRLLVPSAEPARPEPIPVVRRRRVVVTITLVVGTALLGATLAVPARSAAFTVLGLLVAATWIGGSLLSGPLHLGRRGGATTGPREVLAPIALGVVAAVAFLGAALVAREVPGLAAALDSVQGKADAGPLALVLLVALVNAVAEEVFFRGALHSALGRANAARDATLVYVLVTVATLNLALVVAAAVMGTVLTLERTSTRGILAPILTHLTWSTLMVLALPPLIR
ncbi:MAG TPA: CPBP family glutamic-type intramembrane protease [Acidimicrobiales bacterium]|nr:CPBP family glutamic-type intramembrane protease [Acidimicrobiales bacterium]